MQRSFGCKSDITGQSDQSRQRAAGKAYSSKPDAQAKTARHPQLRLRVLKLRSFRFSPLRGSPKLAQGQRPTGAPPWVVIVTGFEALKGRP